MIQYLPEVWLEPLKRESAGLYQAWRNHPDVYSFCRQVDLISDQAQDKWMKSQEDDPSIKMYEIWHGVKADSTCVGVCGLTSVDMRHRTAEFSLYIAPEMRGKSLSKRALETLLHHGFRDLNLNMIWGEVMEFNCAALHVFNQLDFVKTGHFVEKYYKKGKYWDAHIICMTKREWLEHRGGELI